MEKRNTFILFVSTLALFFPQGREINAETEDADLSHPSRTRPCDSEADVLCKPEKDYGDGFIRTRAARHLSGFCSEGWYEFDDKCYKPFGMLSERKSWDNADRACTELGSNLVSIHSEEEQDFLNLLLYNIQDNTWIGLRRSSSGSDLFSWKDSSSFDFTNWEDGEPNNYAGLQEDCVHMDYGRFEIGKWNDVGCRGSFAYICQSSKDTTLTRPAPYPSLCTEPQGWLKIRTSCYKVFHKSESYASWNRAQSLCRSYGGNLMYVKSSVDTIFLRIHLKGLLGPFWTGIKSTKKHKYTWLGIHPLVFSNWQSDQPKEVADQKNCVAVDEDGEWMVRNCDESHPFVCEVTSEPLVAPTIAPYHPNMTCPYTSPKWHDFGGKYCYIIEVGKTYKWQDALCRCAEEGGFLASFHSAGEVNAILKYIKHHVRPLYIGFRRDTQGRFVWSDGSATDFLFWNYGEPNDVNEQCAEMKSTNGKWNDVNCANKYGYICSALKVPVRNESESNAKELKGNTAQLGAGGIALVTICVLTAMAISAFALYYFRPSVKRKSSDNVSYSTIK